MKFTVRKEAKPRWFPEEAELGEVGRTAWVWTNRQWGQRCTEGKWTWPSHEGHWEWLCSERKAPGSSSYRCHGPARVIATAMTKEAEAASLWRQRRQSWMDFHELRRKHLRHLTSQTHKIRHPKCHHQDHQLATTAPHLDPTTFTPLQWHHRWLTHK